MDLNALKPGLPILSYFCTVSSRLILIKRITVHNIPKYQQNKKKGIKPFQLKPSVRIFSRENSKLCFEMLEMNSASQNHLPLQGAGKRLQSRYVCQMLKRKGISLYLVL
jgi:hypothetical protein